MSDHRTEQDRPSSPDRFKETEIVDSPMLRRAAGKIPHVGIIGAGAAGLRCADILLQHGVKVTILEGRNRIGGRLCQSDALGHLVDLGPNWIHGTEGNPILDLAQQTNTLAIDWDGCQSIFDHLGHHMPGDEAARNWEIVWGIIGKAMKYSNNESETIPAERSLYDFFAKAVEKVFPLPSAPSAEAGDNKTLIINSDNDDDAKARQQKILDMSEMWGAFVGSPIQKQSLKFFWLEEVIDGENLFVADTYQKVLNKIAEPAVKNGIKFGCKVTKIVSNQGEGGNPSVTAEIEGKDSETFDEVVMTAPLGWLKRNMDAFEPELPERIKEGITSIGYGNLDKVYITFPTAFWNKNDGTTPASVPAPDPTIPNVPATLSQPTNTTSPVDSTQYPGFTHWARPNYARDTNPSSWNQEAMNLMALPGNTAHPTLLFYTFGLTSLHLAKLLSTNPPSTHKTLLTTFFHPYFSRLPNYSPTEPSHQPAAVLATAWANDELAGYGSYSNFQVGLQHADQDIDAMRRGIPESGVWLAGEHTAPFVGLGTVTGAYWSGEGVAKRIVKVYGLDREAEG